MMVRSSEIPVEERTLERGSAVVSRLLGQETMHEKNRLFAHVTLTPGAQIAYHRHSGEFEAFYFLSGDGEVDDNGSVISVHAGDVVFTDDGQSHGIHNTGQRDLVYIALVTKM